MNGSSPDTGPIVWLCGSAGVSAVQAPDWMTAAERERLARLVNGARGEFIASRWLIRRALGAASGEDATSCRPVEGRPHASAWPPGYALSLSHSGGMAGCAIIGGTSIGLDIEPLARRASWKKVVSRWFSPPEQAWLLARDDANDFLKVWTLKEAWLKATGRGIANNLQTLDIGEHFELSGDRPGEQWQASIGQVAGFALAVVYPGSLAPEGSFLSGTVDIANPGADIGGVQAVNWTLHRKIHSISDPG